MFPEPELRAFHAPVVFERLRAFLGLARLTDAEREGRALLERFPDSPRVVPACALLGRAFHAASEAAKNDEDRLRELGKAADWSALCLERRAEVRASDHATVGAWCFRLERFEQAVAHLERARSLGAEEGTARMLARALLVLRRYARARDVLVELLSPDPGARERVLSLLLLPEHTKRSLEELLGKIRADPGVMEDLARALHGLGGRDDLLRGLSLVSVLQLDRGRLYTPDWWRWEVLKARILLDYGLAYRSRSALERIVVRYERLQSLGVLEGSGVERELREIKEKAE